MKAIFQRKTIYIKPFTNEVLTDINEETHDISPTNWQINKGMSEGMFFNWHFKKDKLGVTHVRFNDFNGQIHDLKRKKILIDSLEKKNYYKSRMSDKTLSKQQRAFAQKRFSEL
jgi:hypothetical protein